MLPSLYHEFKRAISISIPFFDYSSFSWKLEISITLYSGDSIIINMNKTTEAGC